MRTLTVIGAYGRDYRSAREVREAYFADKDFRISTFGPDDGRYINRADAVASGVTLNVRYSRLAKVVVIRPTDAPPKSPVPRAPREPAACCAETLCTTATRRKSGFCTRHDNRTWRDIRAMRAADRPESGKVYALTGLGPCIAKGNTWEESEV